MAALHKPYRYEVEKIFINRLDEFGYDHNLGMKVR